ncbi:hypothetical protein DRJ25_01070 [Candidatus Woesearchaeota archaeon]|nr:MAG: hypothetical protein DRJ25_01070 [Candidatus Woesearchaeota archaeon]
MSSIGLNEEFEDNEEQRKEVIVEVDNSSTEEDKQGENKRMGGLDYSALHERVKSFTMQYRQRISKTDKQQSSSVYSDLEKIAADDQLTLVKAFVTDSGDISDKYSLAQKLYLGILKKVNGFVYALTKAKMDDKIIDKFARMKLEDLAAKKEEAEELVKTVTSQRDAYLKKHFALVKEYNDELIAAETFKDLREECNNAIAELTEQSRNDPANSDLIEARLQAQNDLAILSQNFIHANYKAKSIGDLMRNNYPKYVRAALFSEALTEQAMNLGVAYDFYVTLYEELKSTNAMKLRDFKRWESQISYFVKKYNADADNSVKVLGTFIAAYNKSANKLNGEPLLEKYRKAIYGSHEKLLEHLKKVRDETLFTDIE